MTCVQHTILQPSEQKLKAVLSSTVLYVQPNITCWVLTFPDKVMCYCLLPATQLGRGPLYWEDLGGHSWGLAPQFISLRGNEGAFLASSKFLASESNQKFKKNC